MKFKGPAYNAGLRFAVVLSVLATLSAKAQVASNDSITGRVHDIPDVTVSARRMPQRNAVSYPTQVIGRKELEGLALQNIADAVRRFAGANVKDYGGIGGLKTVSVRSLGAEHTAVVYDGVAVSNCQAGQIDIGRFSLDDIEMLSLSIGQNNELMQSARAFASAGVLELFSRDALLDADRNYKFSGQIKGGSFGLINPSLRWTQRLGKNTVGSLSGNFLYADGEYPFKLVNGKYTTEEKRKNSDVHSWHVEGNVRHDINEHSRLSVKGYYFDSERGLPGSVILYNDQANERLWDKNGFVQMKYENEFSEKWSMQALAKYNYSWNKYVDTNVKYEDGKQIDLNTQNEYYLSGTFMWKPVQGLAMSWANDFAVNTLDSNLPSAPQPVRTSWLSALNAKYVWRSLTFSGTLVNTFMTESVETGERPDDRLHLSPTVSVMYKPWKKSNLFLRLMYKDTFRVPTFNDMYYQRMGNTSLDPEKAHEYNFGITWNGAPFAFTDFILITADCYYNKVDDKIVAFPSTYVWKMVNYGKVDILGADVSLQAKFVLTNNIKMTLSGSYTYQHATDQTNPDAKNYGDQIPYTPRHSGSASLMFETPWVDLGYSAVFVGDRYFQKQNIPENLIKGYQEHSLSASHTFSIKNVKLRLQAEVINLMDEQYDVIKYYPMPGRSWRGTVRIDF